MEKSDTIIPTQSTTNLSKNINRIKKFSQKTYIRNTFFIFGLLILTLGYFTIFNKGQAAQDYPFYRYLSMGSQGDDVKILQQVLNTDPRTQVARSGAGSPGRETNLYGGLTRQAVIKFQQLNDDTVRQNGAGVFYSGALDDRTRAQLNDYVESIKFFENRNNAGQSFVSAPPNLNQQDTLNTTYRRSVTSLGPYIDSVDPKKVTNGEVITIRGGNFSTTTANEITLTYNVINVISMDGRTISFPLKSYLNEVFDEKTKNLGESEKEVIRRDMSEFPLFITVENEKGVSNPYMIYLKIK
jgi:peptidoglycan hydrolase-like protein with peptidoglycan-binding domain